MPLHTQDSFKAIYVKWVVELQISHDKLSLFFVAKQFNKVKNSPKMRFVDIASFAKSLRILNKITLLQIVLRCLNSDD